jgi:hypothetical protein
MAGSFAFSGDIEMSTELRDKLIKASKTYAKARKETLSNTELSKTGRDKALESAKQAFDAVAKEVSQELQVTAIPSAKSEADIDADVLTELKEAIMDTTDPGVTVLDLVMRGDSKMTSAIASASGRKVIEKALHRTGVTSAEAERMIVQLTTAAGKRNEQQTSVLRPTDIEGEEQTRETEFWTLVLPELVKDVESAVERGSEVVVPVLSGDPLIVRLDGSEEG